MNDLSMKYDKSDIIPQCGFTKTGYTFSHWNEKADNTGKSYDAGKSYSNLASEQGATVVLYAIWIPNKYTVKYNGNNHTIGSTKDSEHTYDEPKKLTENGFRRIYTVTY
jgi:hypothetical protein